MNITRTCLFLFSSAVVLVGCDGTPSPGKDTFQKSAIQDETRLEAMKAHSLDPTRQPDGDNLYPPVSYDGRFVAFYSRAGNLVPTDTNEAGDIFLVDRTQNSIRILSIAIDGAGANGDSTYPSIAGDASHVVFTSKATNLVANDDNDSDDIFVVNLKTGAVTRESVGTGGAQANNKSYTYFPAISANGRFVVFNSEAGNLVHDDTNGTWDVFVRDRDLGITRRVSVDSLGREARGPSLHAVISGNGRYIAFQSMADNLVENDINNAADVFIHDLETGETKLVSRRADGFPGNAESGRPSVSHNGRFIAFSSDADDLVENDTNKTEDVFVLDRIRNQIVRASVASGGVEMEAIASPQMDRKSVISPDGRFVAFRSDAPNLVPDDDNGQVDIFLHDLLTKTTKRVSLGPDKGQFQGLSEHHAVSWDARVVTFSNERTARPKEVKGLAVTRPVSDVFVFDAGRDETKRVP